MKEYSDNILQSMSSGVITSIRGRGW
jgi:hypothetical protein